VLEPGLPATNPLDAWGTGNDADQIFATCIQALLEDPATAGLAVDAAAATAKPVAVIANLASAADPAEAATLRAAGVPVLEGTATGLAAFGHLLAYRDFLARREGVDDPGPPPSGSASTGAGDNPAHPRSRWAALPHRGARQRRVGVPRARGRGAGGQGVRDRWRGAWTRRDGRSVTRGG
jgi:hypothetical protein